MTGHVCVWKESLLTMVNSINLLKFECTGFWMLFRKEWQIIVHKIITKKLKSGKVGVFLSKSEKQTSVYMLTSHLCLKHNLLGLISYLGVVIK